MTAACHRAENRSLEQRLQACGKLPVAHALWIARQAAVELAALHDSGRLHGDVRPALLLIEPSGLVILTTPEDSRRLDEPGEIPVGELPGSAEYLAPEAACSRLGADCRSDLYSLGVVLYEMLSGRRPFAACDAAELVSAHMAAEPPPLRELAPNVPGDVAALVHQLLHKQPLRRPQTAAELADRLAELEIAHLDER